VASWSFEKYIKILIQAFDQMDTMACIADLDGRIIFANRAALASVGTTLSEMKGRRLSDTPWRNYSENARKITDLMVIKAAEGETVRGEDFIRVPDGSLIPAIFSITPIIDHQEKVIGLVPQGNIIKELKEVQDRLESERWETREWLDCLSTCVAKCDLKGAVTSCNRAFVRALGISHEEIIGKTIYELPWLTYSEKERGRVQKAIETALGGDKVSIEVLFQTKKGEIAPFLVNMNFISDIEGRKAFLSVEAKDIAKQVELREEMFEREKQYSAKLKNEINQAIQALHETAKFNRNLIEFATIQKDLAGLTSGMDLSTSIFLFHTPPYRTALDRAGLDGKFIDHAPLDVHVGSIAVKDMILERQPLITLHGHVHESARLTGSWVEKLGRTTAISAAHDGGELALVRFNPGEPHKITRDLI